MNTTLEYRVLQLTETYVCLGVFGLGQTPGISQQTKTQQHPFPYAVQCELERRGKRMKTISFVIPVYNEEKRIGKALQALRRGGYLYGLKLEKIIFVSDGSTDKTVTILKQSRKSLQNCLKTKVEIIAYKKNRGKGYAVKRGMLSSTSNYALFFDCDMSTPLSELKKFLPQFKKGSDVIVGTRKNGRSTVIEHQPLYRELLGKCFTLLSNISLNTWVSDFTCGFKAFSRQATKEIFSSAQIEGWGYDAEILFLARKFGYKLPEVPVIWSNDERTKVDLKTAVFQTLYELYQIRRNAIMGIYKYRPTLKTALITRLDWSE